MKFTALIAITRLLSQFIILGLQLSYLSLYDLGAITVLGSISAVVFLFRDLGLSDSIITTRNASNELSNLAIGIFVLNFILAVLLFFVMPSIAAFFDIEELTAVFRLLSVVIITNSFHIVPLAWLEKNLKYKEIFHVELLSYISGILVLYTCLAHNLSVSSVFYQMIILSTIKAIALHFYFLRNYSWGVIAIRMEVYKAHFDYSKGIWGFNLVNYLSRNADNLIIGRVFGLEVLGIYGLLYKAVTIPLSLLTATFGRYLFPKIVALRGESKDWSSFFGVTLLVSVILVNLGVLVYPVLAPIARLLLQEKFIDFDSYIYLFFGVLVLQSTGTFTGIIFKLKDSTTSYFFYGILSSFIFVVVFIVSSYFDFELFLVGLLLANIILWPLDWFFACRGMNDVNWSDVIKELLPLTIVGLFYTVFSHFGNPPIFLRLFVLFITIIYATRILNDIKHVR